MDDARQEDEWCKLSWLAAYVRNVHLKRPQQPGEINPWNRTPRERKPFNLGSIELLSAQMRAER